MFALCAELVTKAGTLLLLNNIMQLRSVNRDCRAADIHFQHLQFSALVRTLISHD